MQRVENLNRVKHYVLNKTNKIFFPLRRILVGTYACSFIFFFQFDEHD